MLYKKMLRDISNYKIQFISIFLMAFLGVFIFVGIGGEAHSLEANGDSYYNETNLADGWIYSPYLNDLFLEQVRLLGPTTQMERQMVVDSEAKLDDSPMITLHFVENNTVSKFYLLEGEPLDVNDSEGVWLDKSFADARNLSVGDRISFTFEDYEIEKEIRGLGYSPEYIFNPNSVEQNNSEFGFAYLSNKASPVNPVPYNVLNVKFDGKADTYSQLLDFRLNGYYDTFLQRSNHPSVGAYENLVSQFKMVENSLPFVFILISMLMLLTTMRRIITHQRTQIGILKANGFKNKSIMKHYLSYASLVLLGSLLALILGPIFMHQIAYSPVDNFFKLPYFNHVGGMGFIYVVAVMVALALTVSYFSIKGIVNESPSTIIRPKAPDATTSSFVEKFKFWQHLSFNFRWNYRDSKRNKFRTVMAIVGVIGCVVLLIYAFGLYEGLEDAEHWRFDKIEHFESKLVISNNASSAEIDDVASKVEGDRIMESLIEIESNSTIKSASLLVLNDTDLITPTDIHQNRMEINDGEISISQRMANLLGVSVGDTVRWHIVGSDKWVNVKIDKIHGNPSSQGFIMSDNKLDELGLNYTATSIITSKHVDDDYDGIKSTLYRDDMIESSREVNKSLRLITYDLIFFAVILALVVLYNLDLLSFLEMEREIATLKVLGFKSAALSKLLLTQNLTFIIIGGLLGIPMGYVVLDMVWKTASEDLYILPFISVTNLFFTFLIILGVSLIINLYFMHKIRKLDLVDTLKILE